MGLIQRILDSWQLYVLIALSILTSTIDINLGIGFGVLSLLLVGLGGKYFDVIIFLFLMLLLSDSRSLSLVSFQTSKKIGLILVAGLIGLQVRRFELERNIIFMLFLPFFLWSFTTAVINSPDLIPSLQKILSYSLLLLTIPFAIQLAIRQDQLHVYRRIFDFITIYLATGLALFFFGYEIGELAGRFRGLMGNPNGLGVVVFLLFLLVDTIFTKNPALVSREYKLGIYGLMLANIFLCGSRSALAAILLYLVFKSFKFLKGFLGLMVFIGALFLYQTIMVNLPFIINELGLSEYLRTDTIESGSGRVIAWQFAWDNIQNQWWMGKGFNYTELLFKENYRMLSQLGHQGNAHNSFLTIWLDTGLIGVILYFTAFLMLFFRMSKTYSNSSAILYAVLFSVTFESWLTGSLNPMTITLIMIASIILYSTDENEDVEEAIQSDET